MDIGINMSNPITARHRMEALPQDHGQALGHGLHVLLFRHLPRPHGLGFPARHREGGLFPFLRERPVQQSVLCIDGRGSGEND